MTRRVQLAAIAACSCALVACEEPPRSPQDPSAGVGLEDFAYSVELKPSGDRAVHAVIVPEAVYGGVRSQNLSDVRVLNGAGDQVPHALRTLDEGREIERGEQALPLFPLRASLARGQPLDALSLRVERDASGTAISVQAAPPPAKGAGAAAAPAPSRVVAYVLDASGLDHPIAALRVERAAAESDQVRRISVDTSDDLSSFSPVAEGQALVSLEYAGQRITRDRVELPAVRARYLRLRAAAEGDPPPEVTAVFANLAAEQADAEQQHRIVQGKVSAADPRVYQFDLGGFLPADGARVLLPEDNTLVQASLRSFARAGEAPQPLWSGPLYRVMHAGQRIESPAIAFERRTHRYFELRVDDKGGGLGRGLPRLEIARYPDQLLFVARGQGPFQLAYGHHAVTPSGFTADEVLAMLPKAERAQLAQSDTIAGKRIARAGPSALLPPRAPPPFERYALWAVLIAGVLALAIAALRIARRV